MIKLTGNYQEWALKAIGRKVESIHGLVYVLDEPDFERPQKLQFNFEGVNDKFQFGCGRDGTSLAIEKSSLKNVDLGEYGREVVMNISQLHPYSCCINNEPNKILGIYSQIECSLIGMLISFNNKLDVYLINSGDELLFTQSNPFELSGDDLSYMDITI